MQGQFDPKVVLKDAEIIVNFIDHTNICIMATNHRSFKNINKNKNFKTKYNYFYSTSNVCINYDRRNIKIIPFVLPKFTSIISIIFNVSSKFVYYLKF